jgi:hypothetical protein
MHKGAITALAVAGLLGAIGVIYTISAYEEPIEDAVQSADQDSGSASNLDSSNASGQGMDPATMIQTSFLQWQQWHNLA